MYNDGGIEGKIPNLETNLCEMEENKPLWNMDFNGAVSKERLRVGVWVFNSQTRKVEGHSYKLNFQCRNNIVEYEALILGLQLLKKFGAKRISIHGDSELIIKQIKGEYSAKHPRLVTYRNVVLDFLVCFVEYELSIVPRGKQIIADGLATSSSTCKMPYRPGHQYTVEVKNRPVVSDSGKFLVMMNKLKFLCGQRMNSGVPL